MHAARGGSLFAPFLWLPASGGWTCPSVPSARPWSAGARRHWTWPRHRGVAFVDPGHAGPRRGPCRRRWIDGVVAGGLAFGARRGSSCSLKPSLRRRFAPGGHPATVPGDSVASALLMPVRAADRSALSARLPHGRSQRRRGRRHSLAEPAAAVHAGRRLARPRSTAPEPNEQTAAVARPDADDQIRPVRSVYSAGHDPRLRRAASGRRRPLVRRPHRQPPRARPERHDPDGLLGRRRDGDGLTRLPARGARLRVEGDVAGHRGVQPGAIEADWPTAALVPAWAATRTASRRRRPTPTPPPSGSGSGRRGTAGPASATSRSPASRSSTTSRRRARCSPTTSSTPPRPATSWPADGSRTSASPTSPRRRSSSSTCPTRSSAATRATTQLLGDAARRRRGAVRAPPPRDRPARAAEGLPAARRRRSCRPPALPRRRAAPARGRPALGDARTRTTPASSRSTRTSRTPGGTTSGGSRTSAADTLGALPADVASSPTTPTSPTSSSARSWASDLTRARWSGCSTARAQMADAVRAYGRTMAELGEVDGSAERYWATGRV